MSQLPIILDAELPIYDTPLPLIVANRWDFRLNYHQTTIGIMYSVHDWMRGLSGEENITNMLSMFKKTAVGVQTYNSIVRLPYKATDSKMYKRDFTTDKGLYLIAQYMRVKQTRVALDEIRQFLAQSGAFVDEVRLEPDKIFETVSNPDKLLDAFIEYHRKRGKDDRWIQMRIDSKIKRNQFTTALTEFVRDVLSPRHYATATDDIYRGLWGRTASTLKSELKLSNTMNLRDHQPTIALHYQGIAEEVCAQKLGEREELWWEEAREIIQTIAQIIGRQAKETSELLQKDLVTGKPLLPKKQTSEPRL
jgi:hypothetical protein